MKVFKHIEVLTAMLNEIQKGPPILIMIIAETVVASIALATLVGSSNSDLSSTTVLLLLVVESWTSTLIVFGQMAMVHQKSNSLLKNMRWKLSSTEIFVRDRKLQRSLYRSC